MTDERDNNAKTQETLRALAQTVCELRIAERALHQAQQHIQNAGQGEFHGDVLELQKHLQRVLRKYGLASAKDV